MADFRVRTPALDPTALATLLQRKAAMEQEQKNIDRKRRDDQLAHITDAVAAGQTLASNMMKLAEQRSQKKGLEDLNTLINTPEIPAPTASSFALADKGTFGVQPSPEQEQAVKSRDAAFLSALVRANPEAGTKALLSSKMGADEKSFAPQQAAIEFTDGSIKPATFRNGKYYYPNTDELIPPSAIAGKGYGLVPMKRADGSVVYVSRSTARELGLNSSAPDSPDVVNKKPVKTAINQLETGEVERLEKTKEDFNVDPAVKAALAKQGDYEIASGAIDTENWVGDAALISIAAKGLGRDVGALSDVEQQRYKTSPAFISRVRTNWSKWTKGIIPPEDRETFREALRIAREKNDHIVQLKRDAYGRVASSRVKGLDPEFAKSYIYDNQSLSSSSNEDEQVNSFFGKLLNGKP